jgi:hypothetical protein
VIHVKESLGIIQSSLWVIFVFQEVALEFSHVELKFRELVSKQLALFFTFFRIKLLEKSFHLLFRRIV